MTNKKINYLSILRYWLKITGITVLIDPYCGDGGLPASGCGFTPDEFKYAVNVALSTSDRYVWIYDEHINWFTGDGIPPIWQDVLDALHRK